MEIQEKCKSFLLLDKNSLIASYNFLKNNLQLHWRCSAKKVLLKTLQNSQENTCAEVSLNLGTLLKNDLSTGVFLCNLRFFSRYLSCRTPKNDCFYVDFFLEVVRKFRNIFKSSSWKYFWHILAILQFWKKALALQKNGNATGKLQY